MKATQGSLVIVGLNGGSPSVFFDGSKIEGLLDIRANWDVEDPHVKLKVTAGANAAEVVAAARAAGIIVKEIAP